MRSGPGGARFLAAVAAAALMTDAACSGVRPAPRPPEAPPGNPGLGVVGIARARFEPEPELRLSGQGRGAGLLRGAGRGFVDWANAAAGSFRLVSCTNEGCAAAAVFVLAFAAAAGTVGAVVGGIEGAVAGAPDDAARRVERNARGILENLEIQEKAADAAMRGAPAWGFEPFSDAGDRGPTTPARDPDYRALSREGIDTVLETAVAMGRQEGTVRGLQFRAIAALRRSLGIDADAPTPSRSPSPASKVAAATINVLR